MKKLTKVLFTSILAFAVVFSAVAGGQGESEAAAADETIVVKTMAYGDNSNAEGMNWVRIVEAFEAENPNIDIDYEMLYDEAYHQKVVARLASGDVPHLAYMGADARWGANWAEANQQYDHRDIIDSSYYEMDLIPPMGPNGEIYEIPLGTSNICTVLFANKPLIESLGFGLPESYEDLVAMVPAAQEAGLEVVSIDGADGWAWGSCLMSAIIARMTGDANWISKAVDGEKSFTDPEFIASLKMLETMVSDGVISEKSVLVDYGTNLSNYANKKTLFCIQGQWAAGGIEVPEVQDNTVMMTFPEFPGEKSSMNGSISAAIQVGYGLTKEGAADPKVAEAALKFLHYFYSEAETTQRLRDGAIVAPILKGYQVPDDMPNIIKAKVDMAQNATTVTEVIDAFLSGAPNDALNAGMQEIVTGSKTPEEVAAEVEKLVRS